MWWILYWTEIQTNAAGREFEVGRQKVYKTKEFALHQFAKLLMMQTANPAVKKIRLSEIIRDEEAEDIRRRFTAFKEEIGLVSQSTDEEINEDRPKVELPEIDASAESN